MNKRNGRKLLASAVLSAGMMLSAAAGCDGVRQQHRTTPTAIHSVATPETEAVSEVAPASAPITTLVSAPPTDDVAAIPAEASTAEAPAAESNASAVDTSAPAANENAVQVDTEYPACPITGNSKRPAYDQATYANCVQASQTDDATDA